MFNIFLHNLFSDSALMNPFSSIKLLVKLHRLYLWQNRIHFSNAFVQLQLQQVLDSFIIFAAQQSDTKDIELPSSLSFGEPSFLNVPWMHYSPSNIRIVPFPTREYTDDEFQSIIKSVMGVLYVYLEFCISTFLL